MRGAVNRSMAAGDRAPDLARDRAGAPVASGGQGEDPILRTHASLIRRAQQICVATFQQECQSFNATPLQYGVLLNVMENPGIDQITVARLTVLDRTTTAKIVSLLERRKLLDRKTGRDRRTKQLWITDAGAALVRDLTPRVEMARQKIVEPLLPEERVTLLQLLAKLVDSNVALGRQGGTPEIG